MSKPLLDLQHIKKIISYVNLILSDISGMAIVQLIPLQKQQNELNAVYILALYSKKKEKKIVCQHLSRHTNVNKSRCLVSSYIHYCLHKTIFLTLQFQIPDL